MKFLGKKCFDSVSEVSEDVDIVDIFRPSEDVLPFVKEAITKSQK